MTDYVLNYDKFIEELKTIGEDAYPMMSIIEFMNSDCVRDWIGVLNSKFSSKVGNRAYPS